MINKEKLSCLQFCLLKLENFVTYGIDKPTYMTGNSITIRAKLWVAEWLLLDPSSLDQADPDDEAEPGCLKLLFTLSEWLLGSCHILLLHRDVCLFFIHYNSPTILQHTFEKYFHMCFVLFQLLLSVYVKYICIYGHDLLMWNIFLFSRSCFYFTVHPVD